MSRNQHSTQEKQHIKTKCAIKKNNKEKKKWKKFNIK